MYCQWRRRCKPIERKRQWGWNSPLSLAVLCARYMFDESHSSALECKVGGKFHVKVNILLRLIANKYHEGNMKRTLKRELKESAFAEQKANRIDLTWWDCCAHCGIYVLHVGAMVLSLIVSFISANHYPCAWMVICLRVLECMCLQWFAIWYMCLVELAYSMCQWESLLPGVLQALTHYCWQNVSAWPVLKHGPRSLTDVQVRGWQTFLHNESIGWDFCTSSRPINRQRFEFEHIY